MKSPATSIPREKPILFNAEMVRAILDGRKTQTRRIMFPKNPPPTDQRFIYDAQGLGRVEREYKGTPVVTEYYDVRCQLGDAGGRLYVREAWGRDCLLAQPFCFERKHKECIVYRADAMTSEGKRSWNGKWRPSIHMPRWASRLTLEIADVRVERLLSISDADKLAEGATPDVPFGTVWKKINTKPGIRWEDNPWCWVIGFKVLR